MKFDFQNFEDELSSDFSGRLDRSTIKNLLKLEGEYDIDTPQSTGKRLVINSVSFSGVKRTGDENSYLGDEIRFNRPIETGVNIWVADNFKGKSSILKIIKYALTGKSSLKTNVKEWIDEIIVQFTIGSQPYTVYIDKSGEKLKALLVNARCQTAEDVQGAQDRYVFTAKSENTFKNLIQEFFFEQFSYYSLKWTQKNSSKNKNNLLEVPATWSTYFKSILLESKDSSIIFGSQGNKIFEMLLGLELTFPINRLKIKCDMLRDELAREREISHRTTLQSGEDLVSLQTQMAAIEHELTAINNVLTSQPNVGVLIDQYNHLLDEITEVNRAIVAADSSSLKISMNIEKTRNLQTEVNQKKNRILAEIRKATREIIDLNEYLEIDVFFSNLEIKQCPGCNHDIPDERRKDVKTTHKCYVCSDPINDEDISDDPEYFKDKLVNLRSVLEGLKEEEKKYSEQLELLDRQIASENSDLARLNYQRSQLKPTEEFASQLSSIDSQIRKARVSSEREEEKTSLIEQRAIVAYRIKELQAQEDLNGKTSELAVSIELLDAAIAKLIATRYSIGQGVIERLCIIMLSELHDLGLISFSNVRITDKFEIIYRQDGVDIGFDDIAEGEQLRAKIALYLSLIQLDIEFNFGRHPRLLIIDSPAKEEADKGYLNGLSSILASIEERYKDKLQIIIATAERGLAGIVQQEYVTPPEIFIF